MLSYRVGLESSFYHVIFLCAIALIISEYKPTSLFVQLNSPTSQEQALPASEMTIRSLCADLERAMETHIPAISLSFPYNVSLADLK